jgi:hypothetical protein
MRPTLQVTGLKTAKTQQMLDAGREINSLSSMKTILIGGDSWGCGEWAWLSKRKYGVSHLGLEQYLVDDGFSVVNCSEGGSSNRNSIDRVARQLELGNYDHIIWFQSDPLRDLKYTTFNSLFTSYQQC